MLRAVSKICLLTTPAFIACHLIKENKGDIKKYCPVMKYKYTKSSVPNQK